MKDGIIKGQGNSRLLKAPETIPATFAEFRAALINGTLPVDVLFNAVGWDVVGTALNKANLLTDAVAAALGLASDDPTVNEAINALLAAATQVVTQTKNGRMSAADKIKLDGVANNANNYVHPTDPGNKHIPSGGSVDSILGYSASGTAIWIQQLALKSLLSAGTAAMYGLSGADANVDKALTVTRNPIYKATLSANITGVVLDPPTTILSLTIPAGGYLVLASAAGYSNNEYRYEVSYDSTVVGSGAGYLNSSNHEVAIVGAIDISTSKTLILKGISKSGTVLKTSSAYGMSNPNATQLMAIKLA